MRNTYQGELKELDNQMCIMGGMCEDIIERTVRCFLTVDTELADKVVKLAETISQKEREIESMCIQLILKQQPVATDLRVISAALKMVTDLHRIGDQSLDIAEIVETGQLTDDIRTKEFEEMGEAVIYMVQSSIEAFQARSLEHAKEVVAYDDVVDDHFDRIKAGLLDRIRNRSDDRKDGKGDIAVLDMLMIAKYLERIGDHAANVGNWVAYSVTG
ncbi:MAG: phosphate signaling complex protein PhoU, partial [Eubacteriales bacterium]|nr:phosphate signaling complex protein PhoU [Eubacteriales bacterium]